MDHLIVIWKRDENAGTFEDILIVDDRGMAKEMCRVLTMAGGEGVVFGLTPIEYLTANLRV